MVPSPKLAQARTPFPVPHQSFQIYILMDRGWIKIQAAALGLGKEEAVAFQAQAPLSPEMQGLSSKQGEGFAAAACH